MRTAKPYPPADLLTDLQSLTESRHAQGRGEGRHGKEEISLAAMPIGKIAVTLLPALPIYSGTSMSLYTSDLLEALQGIPDVIARAHWPPFGSERSAGWFKTHWIRYVKYVGWCRRLPGDLFHITDHGNAQLLLSLPAARTVVTCHDLYPAAVALGRVRFDGIEQWPSMLPTTLRLSLLRRAAAVVAISKHTLAECRNYFGVRKERLFLGYYGISPMFRSRTGDLSVNSYRRRYDIRPEQVAVLHVGSNDPRKNMEAVFRAVAAIRDRYGKKVRLIKVGSKFGAREVRTVNELKIQDEVQELGVLPLEEIILLYRACDVLLYPSFHEGFGRPVAEAMASGTPVVASKCGAIAEVVQDARLLFDPEDVEGMARRIVEIAESDDLRAEIVELGRLSAQRFTWEAHGAAVAEAYRAVAKRWL